MSRQKVIYTTFDRTQKSKDGKDIHIYRQSTEYINQDALKKHDERIKQMRESAGKKVF